MNKIGNNIGFKGFNVDENNNLYCSPTLFKKIYKIGEIESIEGKLKLCINGIHFCWNLNDVHNFYDITKSVICKIEVLGEVINDVDMKKSCTNKIKIIEILKKEEILKISNSGIENTGVINSGNRNSGDWNSGDSNSGNRNSGDWNSGNWNSGNRNSGDWNSGNWNSGNWNSGDRNSGDWNSGFFNSNSPNIRIFNKDLNMTHGEFFNTKYYKAIFSSIFNLTEWIEYSEYEKEEDKAKELIGGYLKEYSYKEACKNWWDNMSDENKKIIKSIPNFDSNIFEEITGIKI